MGGDEWNKIKNVIMKNILLILMLLFSVISFSQEKDKYGFDYQKKDKEKIFLPTWNNIFNTVTMPSGIFDQLMKEYNYEINNGKYIKNISNIFLSIEKKENGIVFYWLSININTDVIDDKFSKFFKKTEKSVKIYTISKGANKVILKIENKGRIGGYLSFINE